MVEPLQFDRRNFVQASSPATPGAESGRSLIAPKLQELHSGKPGIHDPTTGITLREAGQAESNYRDLSQVSQTSIILQQVYHSGKLDIHDPTTGITLREAGHP